MRIRDCRFSSRTILYFTECPANRCIKNFVQFVQPLLDAIRAHTGLWLTLLAGAPPEDNDPEGRHTLLS